jgi:PAS domain S-box-containing protein
MADHLDIDSLAKAYEEGEDAFHLVSDALDIGIGIYDRNSAPLACNESAFTLLGLSKDQFMGKTAMDPYWKIIHEDGSRFEQPDFPIIEVITTYQPKLGVIMGVSRPLTNDQVWLEVNTHPILHADGTINYVFCTYKDVSDRYLKD